MDKAAALLEKVLGVFGQALEWFGHIEDVFTLLLVTAGCVIAGIVLGDLGQVSAGWRGRLYGAMIGGMIINLVAKFEEASYVGAFAMMLVVTALAFFIGRGTGLKLFSGRVKEPFRKPGSGQ